MTRTTEATNQSTARLTKLIALTAIVVLVALGYLMVQKSQADTDRSVACVIQQSRHQRMHPDCY